MDYDVIVIGGGPGGYVAAIRAAQVGLRVAVIEKGAHLGGTCLNIGCIPSKALLDSSEFFAKARGSGAAHGVRFRDVTIDVPAMMRRKEQIVEQLTTGVSGLMKKNGITVLHGSARLIAAGSVEARLEHNTATVRAPAIVLATGSVPIDIPAAPCDGERIICSTEALCLQEAPRRMLVIGGGAIGLELGSVWYRVGSEVMVCEMEQEILPNVDEHVARTLRGVLEEQGMRFMLSSQVTAVRKRERDIEVMVKDEQGETSHAVDIVLVAVGRRPYYDGLDIERVGIETGRGGRIAVNERFETSVAGVYAIGDLIDGPMLAHKAEEEGVAVAELLTGKMPCINYDLVPNIVYTWPEVATVGQSEEEARAAGVEYRVGRFTFRANGRALAMGEHSGYVKILADAHSDRLLGGHIVGPCASDLIGELVAVMEFGGSSEDVARIIHAHPTLSEALKEASLAVDGNALHM